VDGSTETFIKQLATYWNNDQEQFVLDYFRAFEAMVAQTTPTIIGHFDKIKMHLNADGTQVIDTNSVVYKEASEAALQAIAKSGSFLEINTRGMYKKQLEHPYPSPNLLKRAFELNIPLVLNSDAHHPDELDACFKTTAGWLIEMDINRLKVLTRNHWTDARVTVNGLKTIHE
jgi:histidinol-phosphatase (PHP family)